jgi:hypothetical protein
VKLKKDVQEEFKELNQLVEKINFDRIKQERANVMVN